MQPPKSTVTAGGPVGNGLDRSAYTVFPIDGMAKAIPYICVPVGHGIQKALINGVIPSQSEDWRGNPHRFKETAPKTILKTSGIATPCCGTVRNDRFFDTLKKAAPAGAAFL